MDENYQYYFHAASVLRFFRKREQLKRLKRTAIVPEGYTGPVLAGLKQATDVQYRNNKKPYSVQQILARYQGRMAIYNHD